MFTLPTFHQLPLPLSPFFILFWQNQPCCHPTLLPSLHWLLYRLEKSIQWSHFKFKSNNFPLISQFCQAIRLHSPNTSILSLLDNCFHLHFYPQDFILPIVLRKGLQSEVYHSIYCLCAFVRVFSSFPSVAVDDLPVFHSKIILFLLYLIHLFPHSLAKDMAPASLLSLSHSVSTKPSTGLFLLAEKHAIASPILRKELILFREKSEKNREKHMYICVFTYVHIHMYNLLMFSLETIAIILLTFQYFLPVFFSISMCIFYMNSIYMCMCIFKVKPKHI